MRIQLNKVLVFIALLSFIFASYSSEASVSDELKDVQETVKDFISSSSIKDTVENMSPSTIIGLCMAAVILAIVFRGLIFFMIMFGVLVIMFGSTEKATDYLKEKFNFTKDVKLQSNSEKKDKN
jgi:ABC-type bacteriocin/lantibiotic exporter with double-glycine peptidase domain